jgi:hydrogenase small subunit
MEQYSGGPGGRLRLQEAPQAGAVFGPEFGPGIGGLGGSEEGPLKIVHVFWIAGMSCDGCTIGVSGATNPSVEELLTGVIPAMPKVVLHHPVLSVGAGHGFVEPFRQAVEGTLGAPYVVALEGSIPDDQKFDRVGYFSGLGVGADWPESMPSPRDPDQPLRITDWVKGMAPGAAAMIAVGTCATWGGIPAAAGNITGSMGLMDFLGKDYRSALGVPVVNIPGCSPIGDNITETLATLLLFFARVGPQPELDELGRPAWQFGQTVHRHCPKAGYYEEGVFAEAYGDNQCLVEVGCWGPVVQCNIVERGAINHMGGCMVAGGPCIGCTMPGFPDKFSPFYKRSAGASISSNLSKINGSVIRRLRRMSMRQGNREPLWDRTGAVPTAWAREHGGPTITDRTVGFFYKKLQYAGSVDYAKRAKRQPVPQSLDILRKGGTDLTRSVPVLSESVRSREEL